MRGSGPVGYRRGGGREPASALLPDQTGDPDRSARARVDVGLNNEELSERRRDLEDAGGYRYPASQTP